MNSYIERILSAKWYPSICKNPTEYKIIAKYLHPDVNNDPDAGTAFAHLNNLKKEYENGYEFQDESGVYISNYQTHIWKGNATLLQQSKENYDFIIKKAKNTFDNRSYEHFMQYIPSNLNFDGDQLTYPSHYKCIPLSKVIKLLPENERNKHANWIYSRLIELVSMFESLGITHAGILPDSVFVIPEIHGIKVVSFYHVCEKKVTTINGKYKNYYPTQLFLSKEAGSYIDINLIKKTAISILGDISGAGTRLRANNNINTNVLDYLLLPETNAFHSLKKWRDILDANFIKEFVVLDI